MILDMKKHLTDFIASCENIENKGKMQVPDVKLETADVKLVMISEVVPGNPGDFFFIHFVQREIPGRGATWYFEGSINN